MKAAVTRGLGALVVSLLLGVTGAQAETRTPLTDVQLRGVVQHGLLADDLGSVEVAVSGGGVTLTGTAPSLWSRQHAEDVAEKVRDVRAVDNRLEVHAEPGNIPALQGTPHRRSMRGWWEKSPVLRWAAGGAAAALVAFLAGRRVVS